MSRPLLRDTRRRTDDRSIDTGDTLVEIMIAVVIIGITAAGILGGLAAVLGSSGTHRSLTTLDAIVKSFAETAKYGIQSQAQGAPGGPAFVACATTSSYVLASAPYPSSGPPGTQVTVFGSGFQPGTKPAVKFNGSTVPPSIVAPNGDLNVTVPIPSPSLPAGAYPIQIQNGSGWVFAASPFTVEPLIQLNHASGPASTTITATLTGFSPNVGVTVTVGGTTVPGGPTLLNGMATVSFPAPSTSGVTTVTATDTNNNQASTDFDVTGTVPGPPSTNGPAPVSPLTQYQVGISAVQYWNTESGSGVFTPDQSACQQDKLRADQLQQLTVSATAPGASDQLNFVVADPGFILPPTSLDIEDSKTGVIPCPTSPPVSCADATTGDTLTFTAKLTPTGAPAPTGSISWQLAGPGNPTCTTESPLTPTPPLVATCQVANAAVGTYTATATYGGDARYQPDTESGPPITVHAPTNIVFSAEPGGGPNGLAWTTQPVIYVEDDQGDLATSNSDTVSLAIASQPPGPRSTLSCTGGTSMAAVGGVASFSGCQIVGKAGPYTLSATDATSGVIGSVTSNTFPITVGAAKKVVFNAEPGGGPNGVAWSSQPAVTIEDSGGNTLTTSTRRVTLAISSQPPGAAATLTCTGGTSIPAAAGVATFGGCQIVGPVGPYFIRATSNSLTSATSTSFTITVGAPSQLVFSTEPGGGANGAAWSTANQPVVTLEDSGANPTTATDTITLAIGSGPGGSNLTCSGGSDSVAATAGVASFTGCQIVGPIGSYTLTATDASTGSVSSANSNSFPITVGAPSKLVFTTEPGGGADGTVWSTQPAVTIEDSGGNLTTSTHTITLAIATGSPGAILSCTGGTSKAAAAGVAAFSGCRIVGPIGTYTLTATDSTSGSVSSATSFVFTVTVGAPTQLVFTTQPNGGPSGVAWTTQPVVTVEDIGGNTVTTSTDTVTLAITNGPSASFTCNGAAPAVAAVGGVATFAGCQITGPAVFYTITASDLPLSPASTTVLITP